MTQPQSDAQGHWTDRLSPAHLDDLAAQHAAGWERSKRDALALYRDGRCVLGCGHDRTGLLGLTCGAPVCRRQYAAWPAEMRCDVEERARGLTELPSLSLLDRYGVRMALALLSAAVLLEAYGVWWVQHVAAVVLR